MYKTIVTIVSEQPISSDIELGILAKACYNGDEIGVVSINCVKLDKPEKAPYLAEEEDEDEEDNLPPWETGKMGVRPL
jgi:hypothetical protein